MSQLDDSLWDAYSYAVVEDKPKKTVSKQNEEFASFKDHILDDFDASDSGAPGSESGTKFDDEEAENEDIDDGDTEDSEATGSSGKEFASQSRRMAGSQKSVSKFDFNLSDLAAPFNIGNDEQIVEFLVASDAIGERFVVIYQRIPDRKTGRRSDIYRIGISYKGDEGIPDKTEIKTTKLFHKAFLSPDAKYVIMNFRSDSSSDDEEWTTYLLYLDAKKIRPVKLDKLKKDAVKMNAIGWDTTRFDAEKSTHDVLLGTVDGLLYLLSISGGDVVNCNQIYNVKAALDRKNVLLKNQPITQIQIAERFKEDLKKDTYWVMVATPHQYIIFDGDTSLSTLFTNIDNTFDKVIWHEESLVQTTQPKTELIMIKDDTEDRRLAFAWANAAGIIHGTINLHTAPKSLANPKDYIKQEIIRLYNNRLGFCMTQFHMVVLFERELAVYQIPPGLIVTYNDKDKRAKDDISSFKVFSREFDPDLCAEFRGLAQDPNSRSIYLYTEYEIFELEINDEARGIWKLYLEAANAMKHTEATECFDRALRLLFLNYEENKNEIDTVLLAKANAMFAAGRYKEAGTIYAQTQRNIEEVIFKFINRVRELDIQRRLAAIKKAASSSVITTATNNTKTQKNSLKQSLEQLASDPLEGLRSFLKRRLYRLLKRLTESSPNQDQLQIDALAMWLMEVYVHQLNQAKDNNDEELVALIKKSIVQKLKEYKPFLHFKTLCKLFDENGYTDLSRDYAELVGSYEDVIKYWLTHNSYDNILRVLQSQSSNKQCVKLFYKYVPLLMKHCPDAIVETLKDNPYLDPESLVPAFAKVYGINEPWVSETNQKIAPQGREKGSVKASESARHAISYLDFVIRERGCDQEPVHNLMLTLLAKQPGDPEEEMLLEFINSKEHKMLFDKLYALRICETYQRVRARVAIYNAMNLYDDAVDLALKHGLVKLAQESALEAGKREDTGGVGASVVMSVSTIAHLRSLGIGGTSSIMGREQVRKLLLRIVKYLIQEQRDVKSATEYLKYTGLVFPEDILPLYPDDTQIDEFKDAISSSFANYAREFKELKQEMDDATQDANLLRDDMKLVKTRVADVHSEHNCHHCKQQLLAAKQFYLFPCKHMFHVDCLLASVRKQAGEETRARIIQLESDIRELRELLGERVSPSSASASTTQHSSSRHQYASELFAPLAAESVTKSIDQATRAKRKLLEDYQSQLDRDISSDCPACGRIMIMQVAKPLIDPQTDREENESWAIRKQSSNKISGRH